ncbi:hypothetical protein L1887_16321 [Cichorium endivia]|nr:hypothetical protein L1887_16321 [Cichorium endivia]
MMSCKIKRCIQLEAVAAIDGDSNSPGDQWWRDSVRPVKESTWKAAARPPESVFTSFRFEDFPMFLMQLIEVFDCFGVNLLLEVPEADGFNPTGRSPVLIKHSRNPLCA